MNLYDLINVLPDDDAFQPVFRILKNVSRLDGNRMANLSKLLPLIARLKALVECGSEPFRHFEPLISWIVHYEAELSQAEDWLRNAFGVDLENRLGEAGFNLSGHYPRLRVEIFALTVDFSIYKTAIWYGPWQERLGQCPMWPETIAERLSNLRDRLGGPVIAEAFCECLEHSYADITGRGSSIPVPIIELMESFVSEQERCWECSPRRPRSERAIRADFSFNLFRFAGPLMHTGLQLKVASLSHTRRRKDFLWVPDSESGSGTVYSHVVWRERHHE
ncbi:hypothetical protein ACFL2Q_05950 [Thermodesulfobacteriota bacterium]